MSVESLSFMYPIVNVADALLRPAYPSYLSSSRHVLCLQKPSQSHFPTLCMCNILIMFLCRQKIKEAGGVVSLVA